MPNLAAAIVVQVVMITAAARLNRLLRSLGRSPLFTLVAVVTLGVGIGANTAIFSVVHAVLMEPLPFDQADRLVSVGQTAAAMGGEDMGQCPASYFTFRDEGRALEDIAIWRTGSASVTGRGEPERIDTLIVADGLLPLLRVQPQLGRRFSRQDDSPSGRETVILTDDYWRRKFGGRSDVLGQTLTIDGRAYEVVGVLPRSFRFLATHPAVLVPVRLNRAEIFVGNFMYNAVARLKPGVTMQQAHADIARMVPLVPDKFPLPKGFSRPMYTQLRITPRIRPLMEDMVGDVRSMLWVLLGTVGMVLLIACANVANLFLVRAEVRRQEMAVRSALGARWSQLARELLAESLALALTGGALGVALAYAGLRLLVALAPTRLPRLDEIAINPPVLLFTLLLSLAAGLLFGLAPAIRLARPGLSNALKDGGRGASGGREHHRARNALVIAEMTLALVLLIGSGLLIRTFDAMRHVDPGFSQPEEVLTVRISIPQTAAPDDVQAVRLHQQIAQRVSQIPGVTSVGMANSVVMDGFNNNNPVFIEDFPQPEGRMAPIRRYKNVGEGYVQTLRNRLVAGRLLNWSDTFTQTDAVMISESLAREYWKDPAAAVGRRIHESPSAPWRQIVGVVADERDDGVGRPATRTVYWPLLVRNYFEMMPLVGWRTLSYAVRTPRLGSPTFLKELQQAVWSVNPSLPLYSVRTLDEIRAASMSQTSFALVMLVIAAAVSLLLGSVGIYGVVAYIATQRTREIGIRMALGAAPAGVSRLFMRQGLVLTTAGLALGLVAAFALTRFMSSLLFGVSALDATTYVAMSGAMALVALVATYLPARRASRMDPLTALRAEG